MRSTLLRSFYKGIIAVLGLHTEPRQFIHMLMLMENYITVPFYKLNANGSAHAQTDRRPNLHLFKQWKSGVKPTSVLKQIRQRCVKLTHASHKREKPLLSTNVTSFDLHQRPLKQAMADQI